MYGGWCYCPCDVILQPPAKDMIDSIGEEPDDNGEMQSTNPRSFPMTKTDFQKFEWNIPIRIIRQ
jgi:hypothetical protein